MSSLPSAAAPSSPYIFQPQVPTPYPGTRIAPSLRLLVRSTTTSSSMAAWVPMPSHTGHMPPMNSKVATSPFGGLPPLSTTSRPLPLALARLKEKAELGPTCGSERRLKRIRRRAYASVAVPTVERALAPSRSWSTTMAADSPSSSSTSGRLLTGMKDCRKAE